MALMRIRPVRRGGLLHHRSGDDHDVPVHHHGRHPRQAPAGFAPLAIGLALVMIHLVSIPVTNVGESARSTGPALFVGGWALAQLWLFWDCADRRCARRRDLPLAQRGARAWWKA